MIGSRPDGWSRIGNFLIWCTRVRTTIVSVRTVIFELRFLPYGDARSDGIPHCPNGWLIFPFLELGKKSETDRVLGGIRTCCWNVRTDAAGTETSRYSIGSGMNEHFIRMNDTGLSSVRTGWHVVQTDGTVDRWASGRDGSIVRRADKELEFF
jgi:hypothetical protein